MRDSRVHDSLVDIRPQYRYAMHKRDVARKYVTSWEYSLVRSLGSVFDAHPGAPVNFNVESISAQTCVRLFVGHPIPSFQKCKERVLNVSAMKLLLCLRRTVFES